MEQNKSILINTSINLDAQSATTESKVTNNLPEKQVITCAITRAILKILSQRSCSVTELSRLFCVDRDRLQNHMEQLVHDGFVVRESMSLSPFTHRWSFTYRATVHHSPRPSEPLLGRVISACERRGVTSNDISAMLPLMHTYISNPDARLALETYPHYLREMWTRIVKPIVDGGLR